MQSEIVKFLGRHKKAKSSGPFPWDRVFVSHEQLEAFGDELLVFLEGYSQIAEQAEKLQAQIDSMQV